MWIDQHHLAIGIDLAVNVRAAVTKNAVKGYGIPAWLNVGNDLIGRDVVAVPVDSHAIAALVNGDIATVPAYRAVTSHQDRKSTRLNSSHVAISYAVFCLKKKTTHDR